MQRMVRTTLPASMLVFAAAGGGGGVNNATAQDASPIPNIIAESYHTPIGGYVPFRVRMENRRDKVRGGALYVSYRIACAGGSCPSPTLRTGETMIPCGGSEGGLLDYNITHLRGSNSTITLEITNITFDAYSQEGIDGINRGYDEPPCPAGTYSPATQTSGTRWSSPPVTVN
ncbi:MAG: hypothetical protein OXC65_01565 [Thiotrichales bacterium]|nr:hypothetical protein [Thiotrichales bacterium]